MQYGYHADGGVIDNIPINVTEGEFVMNKDAVQRHGVQYMEQLNKGRIPGFNRGGLVATGNVQYRQDGGQAQKSNNSFMSSLGDMMQTAGSVLSLDPSNLSDILTTFEGGFMNGLTEMITQFQSFTQSFTNLGNVFGGLKMEHNHNGNIDMNVQLTNIEAFKMSMSEHLMPKIAEMIAKGLKADADEFKPGP